MKQTQKAEWYVIIAVSCLGVGLRVWASCGPFLYDEAQTLILYAGNGLIACLTDLSIANNHILHSLLVYALCKVFGYSIWCLRLPSFVCGVLMLPAMYALAIQFFNRKVALISLALVALSPMLIRYSSEGRGYGLQMLLMVLSLLAAKKEAFERKRFFLPVTGLLSALSMYTLISHAFAIVGLYLWILCRMFACRKQVTGKNTILFLGNVLFVAALLALFYAPVLYTSGLEQIIGKKVGGTDTFAGQVVWGLRDYAWTLPHYFAEGSQTDIDRFLFPLFGLFALFGWRRFRFGWMAFMLIICGSVAALICLNTQPFQRNFLFLLPIYLVGIAAALDIISSLFKAKYWACVVSILTAALLSAMTYDATIYTHARYHPLRYNSRTLYRLFLDAANSGDYIALSGNMAGRLAGYFFVNQIPFKTVDYHWDRTVLRLGKSPKPDDPHAKPQIFTFGVSLPATFVPEFKKTKVIQADNVIVSIFEKQPEK